MKRLTTRELRNFVAVPTKRFRSTDATNMKIGDRVSIERKITQDDVNSFAAVTLDWNPIHCANAVNEPVVVHGAFLSGLVSAVMGTKLPGPGSVLVEQVLKFPNPCYVGETVAVEVEITSARKIVECDFRCRVDAKVVLYGTAKVVASRKFSA